MKNKILLIISIMIVAAFSFASCDEEAAGDAGGDSCNHTFSSDWTYNESQHWHAATCRHGGQRNAIADHIDADGDGLCDACAYEIGHTHTYAEAWSFDETHHWKAAACIHEAERGELSLHADTNTDGECDSCGTHVHVLNKYGFCDICDDAVKPVVNGELASVVNAISARRNSIIGGRVTYSFSGVNKTANSTDTSEHTLDFSIGTNGTYTKRTETDYDGTAVVTESWIKSVGEKVTGISRATVSGTPSDIQTGVFTSDDLKGYYYTVSTVADGYGAEELLAALFELTTVVGAEGLTVTFDENGGACSFDFNFLEVNRLDVSVRDDEGNPTGEQSTVYKVHYYKIGAEFTYDDNYALTSLKAVCECYTDDPGSDQSGAFYEADVDLDYDPATGKCTLREGAGADTYTYTVTQTVGERDVIDLDIVDDYIPVDFDFYTDPSCTSKIGETLNCKVMSEGGVFINIGCTPSDANLDFVVDGMSVTVTDASGNVFYGLVETMGASLFVTPRTAGQYVITVTSCGFVKTINVVVSM